MDGCPFTRIQSERSNPAPYIRDRPAQPSSLRLAGGKGMLNRVFHFISVELNMNAAQSTPDSSILTSVTPTNPAYLHHPRRPRPSIPSPTLSSPRHTFTDLDLAPPTFIEGGLPGFGKMVYFISDEFILETGHLVCNRRARAYRCHAAAARLRGKLTIRSIGFEPRGASRRARRSGAPCRS